MPAMQRLDVGKTTDGVWFSFTPAVSGQLNIGTCASSFETVVAVYTGSCGALSLVDCNMTWETQCGGYRGSVSVGCTAGTTYWILAGGIVVQPAT